MTNFEQLGAFYLGRVWNRAAGQVGDDLVLYDSRDLTTHAVCVGMTGSGKTGLCVTLIEEAAIDAVPVLAIDPKGDLTNLLLTFPELRPEDFRPWIDDSEAAREGLSAAHLAEKVAASWREGLTAWGQDGARIARLASAADIAVYTPGSQAGAPISVLSSLAAPPAALAGDEEALRERVAATTAGLLTLIGVDADPIKSRDHILVSSVLDAAWRNQRALDLPGLIAAVQQPPLERVGVLDLETFYPARERFALAMTFNNLLASPSFAGWLGGEPLDVARLLWTGNGRPRISILSIAHLSEAERMFFVTLVLNEVVAWVRSQSGSSSLRALLYMDEVFGYLPPVAAPPSKQPLLTLLKQARASGLGVVLATQNPVDLDYKALSNAGTWWLGRLQTERDKARVLDGLEGVAASAGRTLDRQALDATLSGLPKRVFLMHNVHDDAPTLFHTRWALSYLRGPLTRTQLRELTKSRRAEPTPPTSTSGPGPQAPAPAAVATPPPKTGGRPVVSPEIRERHVAPPSGAATQGAVVYVPHVLGVARLRYASTKHRVDAWREVALLARLGGAEAPDRPWEGAVAQDPAALRDEPTRSDASYAPLPNGAADPKRHVRWQKALGDHLYQHAPLVLWHAAALGEVSRPGDDETAFRLRVSQRAREQRDLEIGKLRARYAPKLTQIAERVRRAEDRVERETSQYGQQKLQTAISIGATVLGAMFGRKLASTGTIGRATTAARGASRAGREREELGRADLALTAAREQLAELERTFAEDTAALGATLDPSALVLERLEIAPRKSDIDPRPIELVWIPVVG